MKMELIEGSETSTISIVTPGNYPKENILRCKDCTQYFTMQIIRPVSPAIFKLIY